MALRPQSPSPGDRDLIAVRISGPEFGCAHCIIAGRKHRQLQKAFIGRPGASGMRYLKGEVAEEVLLFLSISQCFVDTTSGHPDNKGDSQKGLWAALHELEDRFHEFEDHEHTESHDHHAVLFSVARSQGNHVTKTAVPIVYDQVELNREDGYNSSSGIFCCANAGVYFFTYTSLPDQGVETSVALLKNDVTLSSIHSALLSGSAQLTERSELVLLQVEDCVWVQLQQGSLQSQAASLKFQGFRVSD